MKLKSLLAKYYMSLLPNVPEFNIEETRNENIFHDKYISSSEAGKEDILLKISKSNFNSEQKYPLDSYLKYYDLGFLKMLKSKDVLDLGCGYGGRSVSLANRAKCSSMSGIEVNEDYVRAARLLSKAEGDKNINFDFIKGYGENLPFASDSFDVIFSFDVMEHVQSVSKVLDECYRVLRKNGLIIHIFPSYYMPTQSHLGFVTRMPMTQWFFDSNNIQQAYDSIIEIRGKGNFWYHGHKSLEERKADWQVYNAGIGVNGMTIKKFKGIFKGGK